MGDATCFFGVARAGGGDLTLLGSRCGYRLRKRSEVMVRFCAKVVKMTNLVYESLPDGAPQSDWLQAHSVRLGKSHDRTHIQDF